MNPWEMDYGLTPEQQKELEMLTIIDEKNYKKEQQKYEQQQESARLLQQQAEETGVLPAMAISAGREFKKLGSGTADLVDTALAGMGSDSAADRRVTRAADWKEEDRLYSPLQSEKPVATTLGSMAPYLATIPLEAAGAVRAAGSAPSWISNMAKPLFGKGNFVTNALGSGLRTLGTGAKIAGREGAIGAAQGALHYDDTALSGAAWGAGGGLAGSYLGKIMGSGANRLNPELQRIVAFGKKHGLFMPPGMRTGNSRLQQLDKAMATYPMTADKIKDLMQRSREAENRLISQELGGPTADIFSTEYLAAERKRIRKTMNDLVANTQGSFTVPHTQRITNIIDEFKSTNPSGKAPKILKDFEDQVYFKNINNDPLTGKEYDSFTKRLNAAADKQFSGLNGDRYLGMALNQISDVFNDAIESTLNGARRGDWQNTRRQFSLLNSIEKNRDIAGYVDTQKLAEDFIASPNIKKLGEVEAWRKKQPPNSLSTSGMLARMLSSATHNPTQALGMASILGARMSHGVMGIDNLLSSLYLSGYPHVTGLAPIAGKYTYDAAERGVPRMLMADPWKQREEAESN